MGSQNSLVCLAIKEGDRLKNIEETIKASGVSCLKINKPAQFVETVEKHLPRVIVMTESLDGFSLLSLVPWVRNVSQAIKVIVLLDNLDSHLETQLFKQGVFDVQPIPSGSFDRLLNGVAKAVEASCLIEKLESFGESGQFDTLVGKSPSMLAIYELIRNVSPTDSSVLITGESGTGKELIAKAIHKTSLRKDKPFVVVNCAAIPENLIESELFGYKAGAFTGAASDKKGLFLAADKGTLFLDEIGDIPLPIQAKLLRVLQEDEVKRLGDHNNIKIDVRILAATHRDLEELVKKGLFREDLYYRLNVIQIAVPPLRSRREDILLLANHFIRLSNNKSGTKKISLNPEIIEVFKQYSWPGNIRELENVIERIGVLGQGAQGITLKDLPSKMIEEGFYDSSDEASHIYDLKYNEAKKRALHHFNRSYIMNLLEKVEGNISQASDLAGMDRSNFKKIIRKFLPEKTKVSAKNG